MPPTTSYSFGDVVLVPFPFTDQSTTKKRPAVIVSSSAYHRARIRRLGKLAETDVDLLQQAIAAILGNR